MKYYIRKDAIGFDNTTCEFFWIRKCSEAGMVRCFNIFPELHINKHFHIDNSTGMRSGLLIGVSPEVSPFKTDKWEI